MNEEPVILLPINSLCILTDPVNCCIFSSTLPNIFEPDENTIDDETIFTIICSAKIDSSTIKLPWILVSVLTNKFPLTKDAVAEPLAINVAFGKLNKSLPSPK